ncbi:fibronectin type III domain-containing protein [Desulfosudis oleivorans]|uniref:Tetratricopeptide TPR_2 repeat protein n=1 Tax=Desulfosudis oleivorans (strain DSM 6200 / JCM 39069 / Hxd3) TaxID=96561 RepID=A8ZZ54_DESOH|nr:tetratricopeptide repeat protein [Desulfosudis oleivorans]ABW68827.1 Tetratricopeptide TPR_2 repeat protein [Desulfosudis oleivorans Hxd3]
MRKWIWFFVSVVLFPCIVSAVPQVNYLGQLEADKPAALAVDRDDTLYMICNTGSSSGFIRILNQKTGEEIQVGGKDKEWKDILRHPTGLALYKDRLYVTDAGLDRIAVISKTGEFIESYGSKGSGPGTFNDPADIFVHKGVIYVADTDNDRIQALGDNGVFLHEIGPADAPENRMKKPVQVAVDVSGRIHVVTTDGQIRVYRADGAFLQIAPFPPASAVAMGPDGVFVADASALAVKKYNLDFAPVLSFGTKGEGRAQFLELSALALGGDGTVYVADAKTGRVQIFLPEAGGCTAPLALAPPPTSARWTRAIAVDPDRTLSCIVARENNTLYAVDDKKGVICVFKEGEPVAEVAVGDGVAPESLAFDAAGDMYVLARQQVIKVDPDGKVNYTFGVSGSTSVFGAKPDDLVITRTGAVCVTDRKEKKIKIYNTDGIFIRAITTADGQTPLQEPIALAADDTGALCVLDAGHKAVFRFSPDGLSINGFAVGDAAAVPVDLAVSRDHVYVLDGKAGHVRMFSPEGRQLARFVATGSEPGSLDRPVSIAARGDAGFLVSDPGNQRIQAFAVVYTPDPPTGVTAQGGPRSVSLEWEKTGSRLVEGYRIYRMEQTGTPGLSAVATTADNHYVDTTPIPGKAYLYMVTAMAVQGNESALSSPCFATAEKLTAQPPTALAAQPQDFSVDLAWQPSPSAHLAEYVIYRDSGEIARTTDTNFTDTDLAPETAYEYAVSAVSVDGVVSDAVTAAVTTRVTTRPPVEIDVIKLSDIFSNTYKTYETNGIGTVNIRNNTKDHISRLNVLFTIKNFMDFASETVITDLGPGKSQVVPVKAVFNDKILDVTEDTPVQTEITAAYYVSGELKTFSAKQSINVYEKHKMTWDDAKRIGAFVTTKDPVVMEFARAVTTQYEHTADPLISGCILFDAMGALGIRYTKDPSNSYQETRDNTQLIDYLQYPRETLQRKSGDCDDLVILYAAALESVGIRIRFVEVPDHILMMFEINGTRHLGTDTMNELLVIEDERVWVPVEVTKVGKPFADAWEAGSRNYYRWKGRDLSSLDLDTAWAAYKPANLPVSAFRVQPISREAMDKRFDNEFNVIRKTCVKIRNRALFARLQEAPDDNAARLQLGIAYAGYSVYDEARSLFNAILTTEPAHAAALNNMGNIFFLEQAYEKAADAYTRAAAADPEDPLVRINLAMSLLKTGQKAAAKKAFDEACGMSPDITKQYRSLGLQLIGAR